MKRIRNERGMALAIAIFALVIVGALVAGAFFAGTQEQRVAENSKRLQQSFGAAEMGLNEVIRNWRPVALNKMGIYPRDSVRVPLAPYDSITPDRSGVYGGYVYRLNDQVFLVDITSRDKQTTRGGVSLKGNALVSGRDTIPQGWDPAYCDTIGDTTKAGIRTPDSTQVTTQRTGQLYGNPTVKQDTSIHNSTFNQFGDISYASLAASANIQ